MGIDPIPVWTFFEIPENAVELCIDLAKRKTLKSEECQYWNRAAEFLMMVKSYTVDQLPERDFDWMIKLRVQFENDEEILKLSRQ